VHLQHLTLADARRVPWKNGRGVTRELLLWPPGASFERGDFDWRIARAGVAEDGPFSEFPGFERVLVVLSGPGLRLRHGRAAPVELLPLRAHRFPGDEATAAELLGAPIEDLNVLARRGAAQAEVHVLHGGESVRLVADHAVVHSLESLEVGAGDRRIALAAGESLWIRAAGAEALSVGRGTGLLVRIRMPAG
jgi:environmental stress-induced protein Ves